MGKAKPNPCIPVPMKKGFPTQADKISMKTDYCLADGIVKTGFGSLLGAMASCMFFKKKKWPVIAGAGAGIGVATGNCRKELLAVPPDKK